MSVAPWQLVVLALLLLLLFGASRLSEIGKGIGDSDSSKPPDSKNPDE
jgi:Sec-independent protein translocase protein TatA